MSDQPPAGAFKGDKKRIKRASLKQEAFQAAILQEKKNGTMRPQSVRFNNKPNENKSGTFSKKQLKIFTLHYKGNTSTESKFFQAVVKGKIEKVQSVIKSNKVDISCRDIDTHETPLHVAAFIGHRELLETLIQSGADLDSRDLLGHTALHKAVIIGQIESIQCLIARGAKINIIDKEQRTPAHYAIKHHLDEIFKDFILNGLDIKYTTENGNSYLHEAALYNNAAAAGMLIRAGVAINHPNNMGNTPLHIAAMSGSEEVAILLAESGGVLGIANRTGFTPIQLALSAGYSDLVFKLKKQDKPSGLRKSNRSREGSPASPIERPDAISKSRSSAALRSQIASPTKFIPPPEQKASNFPAPDPNAFKTPEPVSTEVRSSRAKSTLDRPHNAVHLSNHSPKQQRVNRGHADEVTRVRSETSVNIPLPTNLPPPPPTTPRGAQTARARIESGVDLPTLLPTQVSSPVDLPPPPPPIC
jgi:ankyrin repeat protein